MNWIKLNNQVIIKDNEGKYQLDKDKEALNSYLDEYISPKIKKFNNLEEKVAYHQCQIKYYFSPLAKNEFHSIPIPYIQQLLLCNLFFLN